LQLFLSLPIASLQSGGLYAYGRLSIGKARELAGLSLWEFRQVLAARRIAAHYDIEDLQDDIVTAGRLAGL
jgi:predicted HTH domain antitoxin